MSLARATKKILAELEPLTFASVPWIYNPLIYAARSHAKYLAKYGKGPKEFLLLGMNPGPFGMAQTGVPFGEVAAVRDYLGITAKVDKPIPEHPKRPVDGFSCTRSEVSGRRLWGWCQERFDSPESFFARFYVHNFCPLVFMEEGGKNLTPDKLPAVEQRPLFDICDQFLRLVVDELKPRMVIGVGAFAEKRAKKALADYEIDFGRILHPSPASPLANKGWAEAADRDFAKLGIEI